MTRQSDHTALSRSDISTVDRRYWATAANNPTELKYLYALGVINLETLSVIEVPGADPAERGVPYFQFPTPPKIYEVAEVPATNIIPTQNGGKFVESHGNIFKDIRIGGTVGLRPNPTPTEVIPGLAEATGVSLTAPSLLRPTDPRGLHPDEITGFDDLIFLRNLFRGYWNYKRQNDDARRFGMFWQYNKESESYIVEPTGFNTTRDSANPLGYNYLITLRTLYKFDTQLKAKSDPFSFFQAAGELAALVDRASRDISIGINQMLAANDFISRLPYSIASQQMSIPLDIISKTVNGASRTLRALTTFKTTGKRLNDTFKLQLKQTWEQAKETESLARELWYGKAAGDRRVFGGNAATPTDDAAENIHLDHFVRGSRLLKLTCLRLVVADALYARSKQVVVSDYTKHYKENRAKPLYSYTQLDPQNISLPTSAREVDIDKGEDIRSLARKYMGDEAQWKKLAIMNNLKYPYISNTAGPNVLTPGQKLMVPKLTQANDATSVRQPLNTDESMEELSPILRKYGRDIKLNNLSGTSVELADLAVSQGGDLELIESVDNVKQAMQIKFATELGDLPTHPDYGALYPIGTKLRLEALQNFAINTRRTVYQDPRVDEIKTFRSFARGNIIETKLTLKLKDSNVELPIDFEVRRD